MKSVKVCIHSIFAVVLAGTACLVPNRSTGDPIITNSVLAPEGIVLSGTGGTSNGTYEVLASVDLSTPVTNWPAISTNSFDASGDFIVTNPLVPGVSKQYYQIQTVALDPFRLIGFATVNGDTTGGAGGPTQTVSTASAFISAVDQAGPLVVQVSGTIELGSANVEVKSHKTIVGLGTSARLIGNLRLDGDTIHNVIIRNLYFMNPDGNGSGDGISITDGANHVWIDHCTFLDCPDGQCDITGAADYITISWCRFYYSPAQTTHRFSMLISGNDGDVGNYRVTIHHNWWSTLVKERMPRVRWGDIHSFNNYFNSPGNNYCIRAAVASEVLVENNYFQNVDEPWTKYITTGTPPKVRAAGNVFDNVTGQIDPGTDTVFTPPYPYALDPASNVPAMVTANAGVGKGPFAP